MYVKCDTLMVNRLKLPLSIRVVQIYRPINIENRAFHLTPNYRYVAARRIKGRKRKKERKDRGWKQLLATNSSERNRSSFPSFYAFLRITGRKLRSLLRALCIEVFDRRNFGVTKSRRAGAVFDLLASIIAAALEAGCDGRGLNCVPFLTNFFNLSRLGQLITGQNDFLAVPVASCRRPRQRVTVFPILFPPLSRHALSYRPVRNQFDLSIVI